MCVRKGKSTRQWKTTLRVARGAAESISSLLSALQTSQVLNISTYAQLFYDIIKAINAAVNSLKFYYCSARSKQHASMQCVKNVVSDSPRLVDLAIRLVNSVINLPDGQVKFFEESKLQKNYEINQLIKTFLGLVETMFGLVNVSFSLPEWQAVKVTFFASCNVYVTIYI